MASNTRPPAHLRLRSLSRRHTAGMVWAVLAASASVSASTADAQLPPTLAPFLLATLTPTKLTSVSSLGQYGYSIAISTIGTVAAVGAPFSTVRPGLLRAGAVIVFNKLSNGSWIQAAEIVGPNPAAGNQFGFGVALNANGSVLVVGAPFEVPPSTSLTGNGIAHVYASINGEWQWKASATDDWHNEHNRNFGFSVASSADGAVIAVGAPGYLNGIGLTAIYVRGANWGYTMTAALRQETLPAGTRMGSAVALSADGRTIAMAAGNYSLSSSQQRLGMVFVAIRGAAWTDWSVVSGNLVGSSAGARFGESLAFNAAGRVLFIGAPGAIVTGAGRTGAVFVYTSATGSSWSAAATITDSVGAVGLQMGAAVAADASGSFLLTNSAGAPSACGGSIQSFNRTGAPPIWWQRGSVSGAGSTIALSGDASIALVGAPAAGTVSVLSTNATAGTPSPCMPVSNASLQWNVTSTLTFIGNVSTPRGTGSAMSFSNDGKLLAVGAPASTVASGGAPGSGAPMLNAGAVYVFNASSQAVAAPWMQTAELVLDVGVASAGDSFGEALALSGDGRVLAVGAPGASRQGFTRAGAAFVFAFSAGQVWLCVAELPYDRGAGARMGASIAVNDVGTVVAVGLPGSDAGLGAVAVYFRNASGLYPLTWSMSGSSAPIGGQLGASLSLSSAGIELLVGAPVASGAFGGVGAAVLYRATATNLTAWTHRANWTMAGDATVVNASFGATVALSGDGLTAYVGAPQLQVGTSSRQGAIFTFVTQDALTWQRSGSSVDAAGTASTQLGSSLSTDANGSVVLTGAPGSCWSVIGGTIQSFVRAPPSSQPSWVKQAPVLGGAVVAMARSALPSPVAAVGNPSDWNGAGRVDVLRGVPIQAPVSTYAPCPTMPSATPSASATASSSATSSATATASASATTTSTITASASSTTTMSASASASLSPRESVTSTASASPTTTATMSFSATSSPTSSTSATPSESFSPTVSVSASLSVTPSISISQTPATPSVNVSPSATSTGTASLAGTRTPSTSRSPSGANSSKSATSSPSSSASRLPTVSESITPTPNASAALSMTPSATSNSSAATASITPVISFLPLPSQSAWPSGIAPPPSPIACPTGWQSTANADCFTLVSERGGQPLNQQAAVSTCAQAGAALLSIMDMTSANVARAMASQISGGVWLGLTNAGLYGGVFANGSRSAGWVWTTGADPSFILSPQGQMLWAPSAPSADPIAQCVRLTVSGMVNVPCGDAVSASTFCIAPNPAVQHSASSGCPVGFINADGMCFAVWGAGRVQAQTFTQARGMCMTQSRGDLASITSAAQLQATRALSSTAGAVLIGFTDAAPFGSCTAGTSAHTCWKWTDGSATNFAYTVASVGAFWAPGFPVNSAQNAHCVAMTPSGAINVACNEPSGTFAVACGVLPSSGSAASAASRTPLNNGVTVGVPVSLIGAVLVGLVVFCCVLSRPTRARLLDRCRPTRRARRVRKLTTADSILSVKRNPLESAVVKIPRTSLTLDAGSKLSAPTAGLMLAPAVGCPSSLELRPLPSPASATAQLLSQSRRSLTAASPRDRTPAASDTSAASV